MKKITHLTTTLILLTCPILGHAITYTYDDLNRVSSATYSDGSYVKYSYDAGGNITQIISTAQNSDKNYNALPDDWEKKYNLKAKQGSASNTDSDNDGLTDLQEYQYHTNPVKADSDSDGISDKWEVTHGSNPILIDAKSDSNKNGYTNLQEYRANLNPKLDTDNDGMFDIDEIKYHTNLNDSTDCPDWYCHPKSSKK